MNRHPAAVAAGFDPIGVITEGSSRAHYFPGAQPMRIKIVADGYQVTMWDNATRDFGQWPIGWTAASFLVLFWPSPAEGGTSPLPVPGL